MNPVTPESINGLSIASVARIIRRDHQSKGKELPCGAKPYVEAMACLNTVQDKYILDDGGDIVARALCNLGGWRGETARVVKAHLKKLCGLK